MVEMQESGGFQMVASYHGIGTAEAETTPGVVSLNRFA
jgi:hypothetical protein